MKSSTDKMRQAPPRGLSEAARLDSPDFYGDDPYPTLDRLRREAPVYWYEPGQFWAITRHADITTVENDHVRFAIGEQGMRLADRQGGVSGSASGSDQSFASNPPAHTAYRGTVSAAFTPRRVASLEPTIRQLVGDLLESLPSGEPTDFVATVAEPLPILVIGALLGLPEPDWHQLKRWSDVRIQLLDTPAGTEERHRLESALEEYFAYLDAILAERHASPADDLISMIATQDKLSHPNQVQMINALAVAGNETTRSALSCVAATLAQWRPEWDKLRQDPHGIAPGATEEVLRWGTPIVHFGRTATGNTSLGGEVIEEGDWIIMMPYPSANRDETVWDEPYVFDVERHARQHLAFGSGIDFCLGAGLARLEIRIVMEELAKRFRSWSLAGDVQRLMSAHVNQYTHVPIIAERA